MTLAMQTRGLPSDRLDPRIQKRHSQCSEAHPGAQGDPEPISDCALHGAPRGKGAPVGPGQNLSWTLGSSSDMPQLLLGLSVSCIQGFTLRSNTHNHYPTPSSFVILFCLSGLRQDFISLQPSPLFPFSPFS